jgi:hypothetical protein
MPSEILYLVLACKLGEVHRFERVSVVAAQSTARRLRALGYAVTALRPGSWAR